MRAELFCADRICPPEETVAALRPFLPQLGITRVARQTDLDRIGIPCCSAIRPNGATLSVSQGKGVDEDAAMASAVMEAAEYAIAERPRCPTAVAPKRDLDYINLPICSIARQLPSGASLDDDQPITWVKGHREPSGASIYVPLAAVSIGGDPEIHPHLSRGTNGLASGNCFEEALLHGLCELVERDAMTLWGLRSARRRLATAVDPRRFDDRTVDELVAKVEKAGMTLRLFDLTSDIGVPVIRALIFDPTGRQAYFDLAAGSGCHPVASRAAIRAITEAAQTRVANIAGARDDFDPAEYAETVRTDQSLLIHAPVTGGDPPPGLSERFDLPQLLQHVVQRLWEAGIADIISVRLGGEEMGISVVRVLVPALEDRGPNINWRPGRRALSIIAGLK